MSNNDYTIHEYDHRFDAELAVMWNESDDQWPGTFTDGVPLNEERVREWMDRVEAIMIMVVVEQSTGKVVAYGDLWDTAIRPGSCYVALLNVHPEHQGRSLARRMLVRMVDWAVANGYDRMTIGTWPANLKAMPLYKKVGFFWKPDTSVYMENYLPAVRMLPAAQAFFERHDWYRCYDRELLQVEDAMKHSFTGDMDVYILRWQQGAEFLETVFDRDAQALTGFVTGDWAVYARTGDSSPAKGLRYPFEWQFENRSQEPMSVSLRAEGDDGIDLREETVFVLPPGESRVIRSDFRVDLDAPDFAGHHDDVKTPQVRTELEINGTSLELGTGLRYQTALEIETHPKVVSLSPGVPLDVHLQVRNQTRQPRRGRLRLDIPDGLEADWTERSFEVPAEGFAGLPVTLTAHKPGFYLLKAAAAFEEDGEVVALEPQPLPITAPAPGKWAAGEGEDCLVLENDFFRVTANSKAGEAVIWNKEKLREEARVMEEIGPPFVPWDLHEQVYDLSLQTDADEARAIMTVRSTRFPGFVVGREITIGGSPLIRVRGWVANNSDEFCEEMILRPHVRVEKEEQRMLTVPLVHGLVHEHSSQFGIADQDLPKQPDRYPEQWIAYEEQGQAFGIIWSDGTVKEMISEYGRHYLLMQSTPVDPGETRWSAPLHVYAGPGDWRAVQQTWRRLVGRDPAKILQPEARRKPFAFTLSPQPLFSVGAQVDARLHVDTTREYRQNGKITIQPPAGWQIDAPEQVFDVDVESPLEVSVHFRAEPGIGVGAAAGELVLEGRSFDRRQPFHLIRVGDSQQSVTVNQAEEAGQPVYRIANGHSRWTTAPDFHGGITTWQMEGSGLNQLLTSFPEDGELDWMKPFFGGIRPVLFDPDGHGWPGKLHQETFSASLVRLEDACGFEWHGVRLQTEVQAEKFRGLHLALDYLTLSGSNVLQAVFRVENSAPVYRRVQQGWLAFAQVDGSHQTARLHTADYSRNRTPQYSWGVHQGWGAVENPNTGRTLLAMHADRTKRLQAIDMGVHGAHIFLRQTVDVPPESAVECAGFFILADGIDQARQYAAAGFQDLSTARDKK